MIYPSLDLLAVFTGPTSNGSDRGERRKGNGRGEREEEGKERSWGRGGEGKGFAGPMSNYFLYAFVRTACEDLLPTRMHTYLLEWSYSTRTTMK